MNPSSSRIPHLARAIAEKRQLRPSNIVVVKAQLSCHHFTRPQPQIPLQQCSARVRSFTSVTCNAAQHPPSRQRPHRPAPRPPPSIKHNVPFPHQPGMSNSTSSPLLSRSADNTDPVDPVSDPRKVRNYLFACGAFGILLGGYILFVYESYHASVRRYHALPDDEKLAQNADVSDRWKSTDRDFDAEVASQERISLMWYKRRRLIREAYGDVLEVSVGTGRNMELYDTRPYAPNESASYGRSRRHMITSLTFNDQSPVMVEHAQNKWNEKQSQRKADDRFQGDVNFIVGDAGQPSIIPRPTGGYDTIIQSMAICSMADPVSFLRRLGQLARQPGEAIQNASPEKFRREEDDGQGGRIYLLEHGRGTEYWAMKWLNRYLDDTAAMHADRYGCWYNKDIGTVIEESGLVVERVKRYYFGTVWEVVLRPVPQPQLLSKEKEKVASAITDAMGDVKEVAKEGGQWFGGWWK